MASYEAWKDPADESITLGTVDEFAEAQPRGLISAGAIRLYGFDAATREEASAIHALRMGRAPYQPLGAPAPCPRCGAIYYPSGSAQCWRCESPAHD